MPIPTPRSLLILLLLLSSVSAFAAGTLTGSVTNGTSGKPAAGVEVVLIKLEGGMSEETRTRTDAQGKYTLPVANSGAPHVVRAEYQGVSYNQSSPPGTQSLDLKVYDAAKKVDGVNASVDVLWIEAEPGSKELHVAELMLVKNDSNPPRSQFSDKAYEFYLPPEAVIDSSEATSPGGIPIKASVVPQAEKGHYSFAFPIRPGETRFQVAYHVPYNGSFDFAPKILYPVDHVAVFASKSMVFKSQSAAFQAMKDEGGNDMQVATGVKPGQSLNFSISGYGTLPREEDKSAQAGGGGEGGAPGADNRPGGGLGRPEEAPDALENSKWWILGGLAVLLTTGAVFMLRAPRPQASGTRASVADRGNPLLDALKDEIFQLETDRIQNKIGQQEYEKIKAGLDAALRRAVSRK